MNQQFSNKQLSALLCVALITLTTPKAFAQSNQSTVIVSGSRFEENLTEVPANVKVITREDIANSTSNNIPDVLSQIGGLNVRSTNGGQLNLDATVDMGGFGATANSNTLILVDGQRINPIDSQGVAWGSIPIDSIERIEIIQGGASVQYGNGAVGGVINIITNGGKSNLNQASATVGSYGTYIGNAILRNKVENTTLQLTANNSNSQGWRANSAANAYALDAKIIQGLGGTDNVYADLYYSYTDQQTPGGVVGQVGQGNPQAAKFNNIDSRNTGINSGIRAGGIKSLSDAYTAMLDISYANRSVGFNSPYYNSLDSVQSQYYGTYPGGPSKSNIDSWEFAFNPRLKADFGSLGTTVVGYDFSQASEGSSNSYGQLAQNAIIANQNTPSNPFGSFYNNLLSDSQSARTNNQSIYIISRLPISSKLEVSGGYRHQIQNASTSNTSITAANGTVNANQAYSANAGDIALNYKYLTGQKVYAKWNQSFRFANIDEFWGFDYNTNSRIFSGILKPQTTQTYELGGEWNVSVIRLNSSIFESVTQNEIRYDPTTFYNTNTIDNISRKGVLVDSTLNLSPKLTLAGGGKYQKTTYANGPYSGGSLSLAPNLILNARANYLIDSNWTVGGVINYVSNQYYDASPTISNNLAMMPSYSVADIFTAYKSGSWESRLTIKNVGGANYATSGGYGFVTLPGGNGASRYYYYPSDPRSVFLSVKYTL